MRIALQLHKADPKYAELEVALEMVSAAALAYRHIRHFIPLLIQHLPTGAWKWEVLLAFACPSRVPWLVGCNRRMPDTGSHLAGLAPGRSCSPRELVASLSHLFALLIVRAPRARREVDR